MKTPDYFNLEVNANGEVGYYDICPSCDGTGKDDNEVVCEDCGGDGEIFIEYGVPSGDYWMTPGTYIGL